MNGRVGFYAAAAIIQAVFLMAALLNENIPAAISSIVFLLLCGALVGVESSHANRRPR